VHTTGGRHFLQIPGPTNVPDRVLRTMAAPTIDHRGPEFAELTKAVLEGGKHALVEKAFTVTAREAEELFAVLRSLIATAKKQGWNVIQTLTPSPDHLLDKRRIA
jgi:aspartate aminotransferase-like enzyme